MRLRTVVGIGVGCVIAVGCGGGDDDGKPSGGGSYEALASQIAHPTGQLSASNAATVAEAYSKKSGLGVPGGRRAQSTSAQSQQVSCPAGGNYTINVDSSSGSSGHATASFNNCCFSAGCCESGSADTYYSSAGSYCASYDVTATCGGEPAISEKFSWCFNGGKIQYLITVDGQSFAVSGTYSNGSGTLEITGANGTFTCTYSSTGGAVTGSCSGSANFTF